MTESKQMGAQLKAPFPPYYVKWKPQATKNDKAMAVCYVDARAVMMRLDDVFGVGGWTDEYMETSRGNLKCRLSAHWGNGEWTFHEGYGESGKGGGGGIDADKSSASDSLKRAAVKFGIGRYLYQVPAQWVAYDTQYKRLKETPKLPDWALPKAATSDPLPKTTPVAPVEQKKDQAASAEPAASTSPVLNFGKKHSGKTLDAIQKEDPTYITWLAGDKFEPRNDTGEEAKKAAVLFLRSLTVLPSDARGAAKELYEDFDPDGIWNETEPPAVTKQKDPILGLPADTDLDYTPEWLDDDTPRQWGKLYFEARKLGYANDSHVKGALANIYKQEKWDPAEADTNYATAWYGLQEHQRSKVEETS